MASFRPHITRCLGNWTIMRYRSRAPGHASSYHGESLASAFAEARRLGPGPGPPLRREGFAPWWRSVPTFSDLEDGERWFWSEVDRMESKGALCIKDANGAWIAWPLSWYFGGACTGKSCECDGHESASLQESVSTHKSAHGEPDAQQ